MHYLNTYVIDFDRVETIEDIKIILKEMKISFDNPSYEIKKLCNCVAKSILKENQETFD